ncbi:manganese catalase family protein [Pseudomonas viridiflava]|uniref:manganese catalase family protein n=2 Tax=Pseudomonas viridiflava TaxID=33069 RepID=UPI000F04293C|nr:manganese catalase family protein [Pseudomonas viridiflava]
MSDPTSNTFMSNLAFFDLLLEQFRGAEGELPMATAYLSQAITEDDPAHKAALIRIAKEKIKNARVIASILLELAKGHTSNLSGGPDSADFGALLKGKGIISNPLEATEASAEQMDDNPQQPSDKVPDAAQLGHYLRSNIATEEKQIAVYEQLTSLTSDTHFISALNQAKRRQVKHLNEFEAMLKKIRR